MKNNPLPVRIERRSARARAVLTKKCSCGASFTVYYVETVDDATDSVKFTLLGILIEDGQRYIVWEPCAPWHAFDDAVLYRVLAHLKAIHDDGSVLDGGGI